MYPAGYFADLTNGDGDGDFKSDFKGLGAFCNFPLNLCYCPHRSALN